jgi:hypothetical protein
MAYEKGMNIVFDLLSNTVVVSFRGEAVILPGRFLTNRDGIAAGEAYCRERGWKDDPPQTKPTV